MLVICVLAGVAQAQAQTADPMVAAVGQEWQAAETSRIHLADVVQNLVKAYVALQQKQAAVDAYWKDYVAGLIKDTQAGSN